MVVMCSHSEWLIINFTNDQSEPVAVCTVYMEKPSKCTDAGPQGVSLYGERESMRAVTG